MFPNIEFSCFTLDEIDQILKSKDPAAFMEQIKKRRSEIQTENDRVSQVLKNDLDNHGKDYDF